MSHPRRPTKSVRGQLLHVPAVCTIALVLLAAFDAVPAFAQTYELLQSFVPNAVGWSPRGPLVAAGDGTWYGTASEGGNYDKGTIFKVDASGHLIPVHNFSGPDGSFPVGGLVLANDGNFYGTTRDGGAFGSGTLFRYAPSGGVTTLRSLQAADGTLPRGDLIQASDGLLYGTASSGGTGSRGTVFKVGLDGTGFTVIHAFAIGEGSQPYAGVIQGADGAFYGTTRSSGAGNSGTVYRVDTNGAFSTLHSFSNSVDGRMPIGRLLQTADGGFVGTTSAGDSTTFGTGFGSVFKLNSAGTTVWVRFFRNSGDLKTPQAGLTRGPDGAFYGTAAAGGPGGLLGAGGIFKIDEAGVRGWTYLFATLGYSSSAAPLIVGPDGLLYGTTTGDSGTSSGGFLSA